MNLSEMSFPWPCEGEEIPEIPDWTDQGEDPPGAFLEAHEDADAATIFSRS